jgi:hypothetical protein
MTSRRAISGARRPLSEGYDQVEARPVGIAWRQGFTRFHGEPRRIGLAHVVLA